LDFASLWGLDPAVQYLNHGSFGACPTVILEAQSRLRLEMEREPMDFLAGSLAARLHQARAPLAAFVGAECCDLVFIPNSTTGINAVLRSLVLAPDDELLVTDHTYAACRKAVDYVAGRYQARVVVAQIPFPVSTEDEIVAAVLAQVSPRTRLALLDHVTSPTALVMPLVRLISELRRLGVDTLVDGAHAPGMVPIDLSQLRPAYYAGNAHKWLCAPKGAAFLYVQPERQAAVHAHVISHGYTSGFQAEFDWTGTVDPTPWLCIPECLRYLGSLLPGGWPALMARNRQLALEARGLLLRALDLEPACPETMIGSMASILLPPALPGAAALGLDAQALHDWFRTRGIETWLHPHPRLLLRVSAQLYNNIGQFEQLAGRLQQVLRGPTPRAS
jgi:isopenicillin-N epimerase